jgi:hypothetical protein
MLAPGHPEIAIAIFREVLDQIARVGYLLPEEATTTPAARLQREH